MIISVSDALAVKYADDIKKAIELGNKYPVDVYGRFPWDRSERRGKTTSLSKASIGDFVYQILKCGGEVSSLYPFSPQYNRSAVFYRVRLSIAQKELLESTTEYRFDPPPTVGFY